MNSVLRYVPILKGKAGEYSALKDLTVPVKAAMTPLVEIPNIPWDYVNDRPSKTVDEFLEKFGEKLVQNWGTDVIWIDLPDSLQGEKMKDGSHPLVHIFTGTRNKQIKTVPVVDLKRPTVYLDAVKIICKEDRRGICLRLYPEDLNDADLGSTLESFLSELGVSSSEVDLILDFKDILPNQESTIYLAVKEGIESLPKIEEWRTFVLAASSFPKDLSEFGRDTVSRTPRIEWLVWQQLFKNRSQFKRLPIFGDYSISHPEMVEVDPRIMTMSANMRYTSDEEWIIIKGQGVKIKGYGQFTDLCKELLKMPEYKGKTFSKGDEYVSDCGSGKEGSGNATTWRWIGLTHHLTFVVDQLSNLP
jgi:hypothetical protein